MNAEVGKRFTTPDGVTIYYRIAPAQEARRGTLLLIHGMASNLTRWSEFVDHTMLRRRWDILRPDLRGHGESFTRARIGTAIWCADLASLLDAEGRDRAVVVGHSLGAHVAAAMAARHPDRVRGLVLIDPAFHESLHGGMRYARYLRPLLALVVAVIRGLNALGLRRRELPKRDLRQLDERTRAELLDSGDAEAFVKRYSSPFADLRFFPTAHYVQELIEMLRPPPPLAEIHCPTLVLLSRGVTYTDPAVTKRLMAQSPDVAIAEIDAYHWPLTEKPAQVRAAIEEWCERLG